MIGVSGKKAVFVLIIALFLLVNIGGIFTAEMMMDGDMTHCPYMGVAALCDMSPLEHLSQWQMTFSTTVQQFATAALLLLLAFAILRSLIGRLTAPKRIEAFVPRYRYRVRNFDPLRLAFARGIIHPKVF